MTVKVRNVSSSGDLEVPEIGRIVKAGETVEVPDEIGARMLEQSDVWVTPVKETKE